MNDVEGLNLLYGLTCSIQIIYFTKETCHCIQLTLIWTHCKPLISNSYCMQRIMHLPKPINLARIAKSKAYWRATLFISIVYCWKVNNSLKVTLAATYYACHHDHFKCLGYYLSLNVTTDFAVLIKTTTLRLKNIIISFEEHSHITKDYLSF